MRAWDESESAGAWFAAYALEQFHGYYAPSFYHDVQLFLMEMLRGIYFRRIRLPWNCSNGRQLSTYLTSSTSLPISLKISSSTTPPATRRP